MPGVYAADRDSPDTGRAGLALPFTPTTGRLLLGVDHRTFRAIEQDHPTAFDAGALDGIITHSVGECSVVIILEWVGPHWGRGYFDHIGGSDWIVQRREVRKFGKTVEKNRCYAAVLGNTPFNVRALTDGLLEEGYRADLISVYMAGASSIDVGFAVFGGLFGEISGSTGQRREWAPYGYKGRVGQVELY